ncbi:MAG TPA: ATP phosphoribosyltransferase [Planctomycetota bacterium]|nr:ATP phosphoribosyltransferase [Planctomycetota bacterium]
MPPLKIAVPNKGRLMEETLELLRDVGLRVPRNTDRTLIATTNGGKYQVLFTRAADIPEFVELGAADVGVTGLDLVEETGCKVEKLLDLKYGHCKLVVAAPEHSGITSIKTIPAGARVATAFPNLTKRYFEQKKIKVSVVPVSGATEITPSIGVADLITDLTQTGSTLKQNHLVELDVVLASWAVFIAGPSTRGEVRQHAEDLVHAFDSVENALRKRYLMVNIPEAKLATVVKLIPGLKSPTVMSLAEKGMVAVHAVVEEDHINALLPQLKKAGASGILILPIERMVP